MKLASGRQAFELSCDFPIVARRKSKSLAREFEARSEAYFSSRSQLFKHARIIGRIGDHGDAFEILGGGTNHRGSTDVDVFDQLLCGNTALACGRGKRVEIHDDHINRANRVLSCLFTVIGAATSE